MWADHAESWGHTKHQASPLLSKNWRVTFVPDNYKCALGTRQAASELYPATRRTERDMSSLRGRLNATFGWWSPLGAPTHPSRQNQAYLDLGQEGVDGGRVWQAGGDIQESLGQLLPQVQVLGVLLETLP